MEQNAYSQVVDMAADEIPGVNLETGSHPNGGEEGERVDVQNVGLMGLAERDIYLQVELYADENHDSPETKRKKRMARAALSSWKERRELLTDRLLQKGAETRSIMNEVYQLIGLYSVFVGVSLTAVATSSRVECQHLWSPVSLSLFAYSMVVVVAFKKFRDISGLEMTMTNEKATISVLALRLQRLSVRGYADFDFDRDCHERRSRPGPVYFWRNALGLVVPLTMFTVLLMFSLVHILCWS